MGLPESFVCKQQACYAASVHATSSLETAVLHEAQYTLLIIVQLTHFVQTLCIALLHPVLLWLASVTGAPTECVSITQHNVQVHLYNTPVHKPEQVENGAFKAKACFECACRISLRI